MGCLISSEVQTPNEVLELRSMTTYTTGQIVHLYKRFCFYSPNKDNIKYLSKRDLLPKNNFKNNPITPLLINEMFGDKSRINFVDFAVFLHLFKRPINDESASTKEFRKLHKFKLLFHMYDIDGDGRITKDDLFDVLQRLYADHISADKLVDIIDILMVEMDKEESEFIVFRDFIEIFSYIDMESDLIFKFPE